MKADNINNFFNDVYAVVKQIPYGKVTTYGYIATLLGKPQAARIVGWALNASIQNSEYIPAHRVVNRKGLLTGKKYFPEINMMSELLQSEGIIIEDNKIVNFNEVLWTPTSINEI